MNWDWMRSNYTKVCANIVLCILLCNFCGNINFVSTERVQSREGPLFYLKFAQLLSSKEQQQQSCTSSLEFSSPNCLEVAIGVNSGEMPAL